MLKHIFKKIIVFIITLEARLVLGKYKPSIIAVTGNIGKTSSKDAIFTVLSNSFFVRKSEKSFNSEIGIPLTILGLSNAWSDFFLWQNNIINGLKQIILRNNYPKWLILEVGADRPGDIRKVSKWLKPDVVVMTHLPDVPVHVEYFSSPDDVIEEKSHIVKALKKEGIFVVNGDDRKTLELKKITEGKKVITYGFSQDLNFVASNYDIIYKNDLPKGISFRIDYNGKSTTVELYGVLGKQHVYPALCAVAVGASQGLDLISMGEIIKKHEPSAGRMKIIDGINNSVIIDDSYNASPVAMKEAINTLASVKAYGKKIAVLGDMMELGEYSHDAHLEVGTLVATNSIDMLITIGIRAKYIAQGAIKGKMKKKDIYEFNDSQKAGEMLAKIVDRGDIVLVKGSQSIRTEKVVESIMSEPERKSALLVRQEDEWKRR